MQRARGGVLLFTFLARAAAAQPSPVAGEWRGTLTSAAGAETPFVLTITQSADGFTGTTGGLGATSEMPLTTVTVDGNAVSIDAESDSGLGAVKLSGALTIDGQRLSGAGSLAVGAQQFAVRFDLQRRARRTVVQPQVGRTSDYFVGRWQFDYLGAEYPPLSAGTRSGTVSFARIGASSFVRGQVAGDLAGQPYGESIALGYDDRTDAVVFVERRADGTELVSLGDWSSPLAITFETAPVESDGRTYQLRRVISVRSDTAFDVTEDFSIDGGPFRRLGNAKYTRVR